MTELLLPEDLLPDDYERKAVAAWLRICERRGFIPQQPSNGVEVDDGGVVVLHNCNGELARLRWDGRRFMLHDPD